MAFAQLTYCESLRDLCLPATVHGKTRKPSAPPARIPNWKRSSSRREAGPVHVGYPFRRRLGIDAILEQAGLRERARRLSCALTLNRLIHPASELAMPEWIRSTALPGILGVDFQALAERELNLFELDQTVFLHLVTRTCLGLPR